MEAVKESRRTLSPADESGEQRWRRGREWKDTIFDPPPKQRGRSRSFVYPHPNNPNPPGGFGLFVLSFTSFVTPGNPFSREASALRWSL